MFWRKPKVTGHLCEICGNNNVNRVGNWDYCPIGHTYIGVRAE